MEHNTSFPDDSLETIEINMVPPFIKNEDSFIFLERDLIPPSKLSHTLENESYYMKNEIKAELEIDEIELDVPSIKCFSEKSVTVKVEDSYKKLQSFLQQNPEQNIKVEYYNAEDNFGDMKFEKEIHLITGKSEYHNEILVEDIRTEVYSTNGAGNKDDDSYLEIQVDDPSYCEPRETKPIKEDSWEENMNMKRAKDTLDDAFCVQPEKTLCRYCLQQFHSSAEYIDHLNLHNVPKPYICLFCDRSYSNYGHRNIHHRIHTGDMPYKCKVCHQKFRYTSVFKRHKRTHTKEMFLCEVCGKEFLTNTEWNRHMNTRHLRLKPYNCPFCHASYTKNNYLMIHLITEHQHDRLVIPKSTPPVIVKIIKDSLPFYRKLYADESPPNVENVLENAALNTAKDDFDVPNAIESGVEKHILQSLGYKAHICPICNASFKFKPSLDAHEACHNSKPFRCLTCSKEFYLEKSYLRHLSSIHNGQKSKKCLYCHKVLYNEKSYQRHMKYHYNKKLNCVKCPMKFTSRRSLNCHVNEHKDDNLFSCSECTLLFSNYRKLCLHINHSHPSLPEEDHKTQKCISTTGIRICSQKQKCFSSKNCTFSQKPEDHNPQKCINTARIRCSQKSADHKPQKCISNTRKKCSQKLEDSKQK